MKVLLRPHTGDNQASSMFPESMEKDEKLRISFIGDPDSFDSYSTMLIKIEGFKDFAKASTYTKACEKWFENIIIVGEDSPTS